MFKDTSLASETRRVKQIQKQLELKNKSDIEDVQAQTDSSDSTSELDVIQELHESFVNNI